MFRSGVGLEWIEAPAFLRADWANRIEVVIEAANDDAAVLPPRRLCAGDEAPPASPESEALGAPEHEAAAASPPPHGEIAARIWLDPKDTGAVGYSLKVVYP